MPIRGREMKDGWVRVISMRSGDLCREAYCEIMGCQHQNMRNMPERSGDELRG